MTGHVQVFRQKLEQFRSVSHLPRWRVREMLKISNKTHGRMVAILRQEVGGKNKLERAAELRQSIEAFIGDRDPLAVTGVVIAAAVGCSRSQANRAKAAIVKERLQRQAAVTLPPPSPPPQPVKLKVHKPERMFWTVGDRLFCEHRQPQEVGA